MIFEDVLRRLRTSSKPESVDRERWMAGELFGRAMSAESESRQLSMEAMQRIAKQSIAAACVFWEEWEIASLTPDLSDVSTEREEGYCVGEMR